MNISTTVQNKKSNSNSNNSNNSTSSNRNRTTTTTTTTNNNNVLGGQLTPHFLELLLQLLLAQAQRHSGLLLGHVHLALMIYEDQNTNEKNSSTNKPRAKEKAAHQRERTAKPPKSASQLLRTESEHSEAVQAISQSTPHISSKGHWHGTCLPLGGLLPHDAVALRAHEL